MINARLRATWDRLLRPVGRGLARLGISPDAITLLGVVIHVAVAVLILEGRLLSAGLLAIVAVFTDVFDGAVAKARGITSNFGALLDSSTDRITEALLLLPIAWLYAVRPDTPEHDEPWVAAVAAGALVASFLVSYVKARAESLGFECSVGIAERAERMILVVGGMILDLLPITLTALAVLTAITFLQRVLHVRAQTAAT